MRPKSWIGRVGVQLSVSRGSLTALYYRCFSVFGIVQPRGIDALETSALIPCCRGSSGSRANGSRSLRNRDGPVRRSSLLLFEVIEGETIPSVSTSTSATNHHATMKKSTTHEIISSPRNLGQPARSESRRLFTLLDIIRFGSTPSARRTFDSVFVPERQAQ